MIETKAWKRTILWEEGSIGRIGLLSKEVAPWGRSWSSQETAALDIELLGSNDDSVINTFILLGPCFLFRLTVIELLFKKVLFLEGWRQQIYTHCSKNY